ncbi:MAG: helix-turn-helix domain-containing protein [Eubacterium sp.]|nr:helix-turn-helix domain-containing protein [Eubacterium sp.]
MTMPLSMWNYRDWFRSGNIPHVFSIRSTENTIYGVRFHTHQEIDGNYALLSEASPDSEYRTILSHGDDRIFFRDLSPFAVMNEISRMHRLIAHWEKKLSEINLTHGSLTELLDESTKVLNCPLTVSFCDRLLAVSTQFEKESRALWSHYLQYSLEDLIRVLPADSSAYSQYASSDPVLIHTPVYQGRQCLLSNFTTENGKYIRITAFTNKFPFSPGSLHFMRRLTDAIRQNIHDHDERYSARHVDLHAFFSGCAAGHAIDRAAALQVIHRLGWNCNDPYTVFKIALKHPSDTLLIDKLYQTLRSVPSSVSIRYNHAVYLVCNCSGSASEQPADQILKKASARLFSVSQSNITTDFLSLPQLFLQADEAFLHAVQSETFFLSFAEIMTDYVLQRIHHNAQAETLIHPAVRFLQEEDHRNQTQYARSLFEWLRLGCNYNAAAKTLDLHRNTLVSRLDRICTLTGLNLNDPAVRESLLLSFLLF